MRRINTPFLIVGIVLALVAVAGLFILGSLLNPAPVNIPVAIGDIPAGTVLQQGQFRLEAWNGVRAETLARLHTTGNFPVGQRALTDIPQGSPLYKAYVADPANAAYAVRLTSFVSDTNRVLMALPVSPDLGGNIPVNGDVVDLVFALGSVQARELTNRPEVTPPPPTLGGPVAALEPTPEVTTTLPLPAAVLILEDIPVIHVEREKIVTSNSSILPSGEASSQPTVIEGNALRLYVSVTREQAEVLAFALHSGKTFLAVYPSDGRRPEYPGGITWQDFEDLFFERRPTPTPVATPARQ